MQQVFVSDVSNHGWLGYIDYFNEDGTIVFYRNNPWDYVSLDSGSCALTNGSFNLSLVVRADEIIYLDRAFFSWLASLYLYRRSALLRFPGLNRINPLRSIHVDRKKRG